MNTIIFDGRKLCSVVQSMEDTLLSLVESTFGSEALDCVSVG